MARKEKKFNNRELTQHLRDLAVQVHDCTEDGVITKGEALARLLFDKSLGYVQKQMDDEGKETEVYYKPEAWAIQLVYERLEGRAPQAVDEKEGRLTAAEKVSDLAKSRLNALVTAGAPAPKGPPPLRKKD